MHRRRLCIGASPRWPAPFGRSGSLVLPLIRLPAPSPRKRGEDGNGTDFASLQRRRLAKPLKTASLSPFTAGLSHMSAALRALTSFRGAKRTRNPGRRRSRTRPLNPLASPLWIPGPASRSRNDDRWCKAERHMRWARRLRGEMSDRTVRAIQRQNQPPPVRVNCHCRWHGTVFTNLQAPPKPALSKLPSLDF
jgi:hypothetical protein